MVEKVIQYWTKFALKTHLNENQKIIMEFGYAPNVVGKPLMSRI